jgi:hypothetical protein
VDFQNIYSTSQQSGFSAASAVTARISHVLVRSAQCATAPSPSPRCARLLVGEELELCEAGRWSNRRRQGSARHGSVVTMGREPPPPPPPDGYAHPAPPPPSDADKYWQAPPPPVAYPGGPPPAGYPGAPKPPAPAFMAPAAGAYNGQHHGEEQQQKGKSSMWRNIALVLGACVCCDLLF